jgi:hypothetical protein
VTIATGFIATSGVSASDAGVGLFAAGFAGAGFATGAGAGAGFAAGGALRRCCTFAGSSKRGRRKR